MLILSVHFGAHDTTAVAADDYKILAAVQAERLTRIKGDGRVDALPATIDEALRIAGARRKDVGVLCCSRAKFDAEYHANLPPLKAAQFAVRRRLAACGIGEKKKIYLWKRYQKAGHTDHAKVFRADAFMQSLNLPPQCVFFDYAHHLAHALSALFFTNWTNNALLYTADGGGDWVYYSAHALANGKLQTFYGGDEQMTTPTPFSSIGLAYGYMTQALGYKINRHEGKLTGLAAFGEPAIAPAIARHFSVASNGQIHSNFASNKAMKAQIVALAKTTTPANAAASIQHVLESVITTSVRAYLQNTGANKIGLAGGVFANVALNRRLAEIPGVEEVFIFPGMGDEGIAVGGLYEYLLKRDGLPPWLAARRRLQNVYWGGAYDEQAAALFVAAPGVAKLPGAAAQTAARLLAEGAIVALYCGRMEFGPRALGARSILASAANAGINATLNKRLTRTEFMPFAPYCLEEDADEVFEVAPAARYAMRFMTITCKVRPAWASRIPAVVHVDGTARPQIVCEQSAPLYAAILRQYKARTALPVLVNTSFNAHEEPIICKPEECLRALQTGRVDYVALADGVWGVEK